MPRILVVEDSPAIRSFVHQALEGEGGALGQPEGQGERVVVEAQNGFEAMRLLPRGNFDLVVTDIHMPDINGLELVRFLRASERYSGVAVLLISSKGKESDKERGLSLGADGYLPKPFSPEELRGAARVALEARAALIGVGGRARKVPQSSAPSSEGSG